MNETDWEGRYQAGETSWDKGAPSPGLVDFLAAHPELPRGNVLVPGCGTGHDARLWAQHGFTVRGYDLAPSAVRLAREKTGPGVPAEFRLGDFLVDTPDQQFDYLVEHTLYCAISPTRRDDYVQAVLRWLKPDGQFIAIHYMLRDSNEPPHGCTQEELMERFLPHFELVQGYVPRSYPNRTGQELLLWWKRRRVEATAGR